MKYLSTFLKNKFQLILKHRIILLILILASILRLIGTFPGYQPFHPDEGMSYSSATSMIKNNNFDPLRYDYPSVVPLTNYLIFRIVFIPIYWGGYYLNHVSDLIRGAMTFPLPSDRYPGIFQSMVLGWRDTNALAWGRIITALFGVGNVILIYLLAKKIFNKQIGLISAILVAVNYRQVLNSHFGLPDIYNAFYLMLALYAQLHLLKKPNLRNYILSAFLAGISFSTKYQFFPFISFFLIHLYLSLQNKTLQNKLHQFFTFKALIVPFIVVAVFVVLNPYHLINLDKTIAQVSYSAAKYKGGRMSLDFYSFWYLYTIGIGKITSTILLIGVAVMLVIKFRKAVFLLSVAIPFLFMMTYYSAGGYYTRNFITITPLLLIFAGFAVNWIWSIFSVKSWLKIVPFLLISVMIWENLSNAIIVPQEYSQSWNYRILTAWMNQKLPEGSKISAHSSVFFPSESYTRLPYDFIPAFSLAEFKEQEADFAIANLDIMTNDFYWWIGKIHFPDFWDKPVNLLEQTYPAMAVRELSDSAVFSVLNRWQAPDSNFIVAKIPEYKVINKEQAALYSFENSDNGWEKQGLMGYKDNSLFRKEGNLVISGGSYSPILRWESPPIAVNTWKGFLIETKMKSETQRSDPYDGFIFASFYPSLKDAVNKEKRLGVNLTSRNNNPNKWVEKTLKGVVPNGAAYMTIGFQSYGYPDSTIYLEGVTVYQADVEVNYQGWQVRPLAISPDVLFPFSHGML